MKKGILPIWQPQGFSTHLIARRVADKYGVKVSHTGTLDPMARGVIIVLLGEDRYKKYEYAKWRKTYIFEIIFGIETDTFDGMGIIKNVKFPIPNIKFENNFIGEYKQQAPEFSVRKGRKISGEIYKLKLINSKEISLEILRQDIFSKINKVTGDFRQEEIIKQWKKFNKVEKINTSKFEVEMSKGLYVRSLSQDICKKLNTVGFVNNIVRTKNGKYSRKKCKTMERVFGKGFMDKYDFASRGKA